MPDRSGGEWLDVAERVEALIEDLSGTDLSLWKDSLGFLLRDCQREAGRQGELEIEAFQDAHFDDDRRVA